MTKLVCYRKILEQNCKNFHKWNDHNTTNWVGSYAWDIQWSFCSRMCAGDWLHRQIGWHMTTSWKTTQKTHTNESIKNTNSRHWHHKKPDIRWETKKLVKNAKQHFCVRTNHTSVSAEYTPLCTMVICTVIQQNTQFCRLVNVGLLFWRFAILRTPTNLNRRRLLEQRAFEIASHCRLVSRVTLTSLISCCLLDQRGT